MPARSSGQEDYLLRLIQELAAAARRLRELLVSSPDQGAGVRVEVGQSIERLLGRESGLLTRVDAATAARLVGSRARMDLWIELLELDADACEAVGLADVAREARRRTAALRQASAALTD